MALLKNTDATEIVGLDVAHHVLQRARERLRLDRLPPLQQERIRLIQGALTYRDERLDGFDAAAVVEVIEHLDPPRLGPVDVEHAFGRPSGAQQQRQADRGGDGCPLAEAEAC